MIYGFKIGGELLQVAVVYIFKRVQHMDDAPLYLGIRINCAYRFLKTRKQEQHILHAVVFQVIQHS